MNLRKRVLTLLEGGTPDRLPWFADLAYWHFGEKMMGRLEKRYQGFEGILNLHRDYNVGFYQQSSHPYSAVHKNCEVTEVKRNTGEYEEYRGILYNTGIKLIENNNDNNDIIREIKTPIGTIKEQWKYSPITFSWAPYEYLIKTKRDLKIFNYWIEDTAYRPEYDQAKMVKEMVGDQGCVTCEMPRSPFMQLFVDYIGIETLIDFILDENKLFSETLKLLEIKSDEAADIALDSPAEFIMMTENISSDMLGKRFYEEYVKEFEIKWNKKIKNKNKYSFCHFDGYLKGLLKEVATAGFSVIEAMTPKPSGDLEVSEFNDYVKDNSIIWGGIPGSVFSSIAASEEEFGELVKKAIEVMTTAPQYVISIADQIPPNGDINRVKIVSDLIEKYGQYKMSK